MGSLSAKNESEKFSRLGAFKEKIAKLSTYSSLPVNIAHRYAHKSARTVSNKKIRKEYF
jgi:hypothetical protein